MKKYVFLVISLILPFCTILFMFMETYLDTGYLGPSVFMLSRILCWNVGEIAIKNFAICSLPCILVIIGLLFHKHKIVYRLLVYTPYALSLLLFFVMIRIVSETGVLSFLPSILVELVAVLFAILIDVNSQKRKI